MGKRRHTKLLARMQHVFFDAFLTALRPPFLEKARRCLLNPMQAFLGWMSSCCVEQRRNTLKDELRFVAIYGPSSTRY